MTNFNITVVSDPICPFCYLGKKRLERAIQLYQKTVPNGSSDTFSFQWRPFYLDPSLPAAGVPTQERMAAKFGPDRVAAMTGRLALMGEAEGIRFSFQGKMGNTRDAHRVIELAGATRGAEAQGRVVGEIMRSYFEEAGDVTSHDMLVAAAKKAGLEESEVRGWLEQDKGGPEVDDAVQAAYRKGIRGVPDFTINERYEISGAQDVEAFVAEFVKV